MGDEMAPPKVPKEEPEEMVRVDEETGEVLVDPEPGKTDVDPEFVEANRGK